MRRPLVALALVITFLLTACGAPTASNGDATTTARQGSIYTSGQPVPLYDFSQPRDVLIQIYNAEMHAVNTWSVWYEKGSSTPLDWCPSIGYPIDGGVQLTAPNSIEYHNDNGGGNILKPQAEPDGLFHPDQSLGTYVLCLRKGKTELTRVESDVVTYAHPITVENGVVKDSGGDGTVTINLRDSTTAPAVPATPVKPKP